MAGRQPIKVILFGATGMVGQGVLRECLRDPAVERVLSVVRKATKPETGPYIMPQSAFEISPLAPRRTATDQSRDQNLGFGSVVSRESRQRLLNRDGSFNVIRSGLGLLETLAPYHQLLTISCCRLHEIESVERAPERL